MFWRLGFQQTSPVETILEKESFTLEELLEEDDVIQECKAINRKLITYMSTPTVVSQLIRYATVEADDDAEAKVRVKYPVVAAELLCSDMQSVYDVILGTDDLCDQFFGFLDGPGPQNPMYAGYFAKICSALLSRKPQETIEVFKQRDVVGACLKNLSTYSMVDTILRLVAEVEDTTSTLEASDTEWIFSYGLVAKLLDRLNPANSAEEHANVAACLTGIVKGSSRVTPSPLVRELASAECVKQLLNQVFSGSGSSLMSGLTVLVELLGANPTQGANDGTSPLVSEMLQRLRDFVKMLESPPAAPAVTNTAGTLSPPLGQNRLMIVEVLQAMVSMQEPEIDHAMVELKVVPMVLSMVTKYEWNNLLHNHIKDMMLAVLASPADNVLRNDILSSGTLASWILSAEEQNVACVAQRGTRVGFAAQLVVISNALESAAESDSALAEQLKAHAGWTAYVSESLDARNQMERRQLGGHKPATVNANDTDDGFGNTGGMGMGGGGFGGFGAIPAVTPDAGSGADGGGDGDAGGEWKPRNDWGQTSGDMDVEDSEETGNVEPGPSIGDTTETTTEAPASSEEGWNASPSDVPANANEEGPDGGDSAV